MSEIKYDQADSKTISEISEILNGAFAEGVDLGSRETQIRSIGESLEVSLQYLRIALANVNIDPDGEDISRHLDAISYLARLATSYGVDECQKDNKY